ncbi:MAG TPA: DoxX family protein [Polyangiaceae bacterium]|jgi:uncharacterized membrane protein YphA (DoxX/SURF4 family)|nr:DoxX family protein [Polyangiaceae bacterium]
MKARKLGYWVATGLVALAFGMGGVMDALRSPEVLAGMAHLGYPAHFALLLGVWKILGAVAVAVPGFARVKEWAYAGMFIDLTGAAVAHASAGDPAGNVLTPLLILAVVAASYLLRPESRRLPAPESERPGARELATA